MQKPYTVLKTFFTCLILLVCFSASAWAGPGDTIKVVTFNQEEWTWPGAKNITVAGFPDQNTSIRKAILRMDLGCASGGCDPWDVTAPIWVGRTLPGGGTEYIEIARFITPYGRTGQWEWDVTDYLPLLRDTVTVRHSTASYTAGAQGFAVTLTFYFIEGTPPREPYKIDRLWQGNYAYGVNTTTFNDYLLVDTMGNGDTVYNYLWDNFIVYDSVLSFDSTIVGSGTININDPVIGAAPDSKIQTMWKASELTSAGLSSGDISGMRFRLNSTGSQLDQLTVRIKHSTKDSLTMNDFESTGFTEVYKANSDFTSTGWQALKFTQPFNWNGTSNVVVELCYDNKGFGTNNNIAGDLTTYTSLVMNAEPDYYLEIDDTNYIEVPTAAVSGLDSTVTITFWQYGDFNEQPQNDHLFEAENASGNRVLSSHLPWGNRRVFWEAGNDGGNYDSMWKVASPADFKARWVHWAFTKDVRTGEMKIYLDGQPWSTSTGKTRDMTGIDVFKIGSNTIGRENYDGIIDEFQIFDAVLDSATIHDWMYRKPNANHPFASNLLLYYPFDEGTGTSIGDSSGNGHHGTLRGAQHWMGHERLEGCYRAPDAFQGNLRPQVIFEQGTYNSHIDSILVDSSVSMSVYSIPTYNSFDSTVKTLRTNIDAGAAGTRLKVRTTGHGFGGNNNCAEFCRTTHQIIVNGNAFYTWDNWNDDCGMNASFPQGGTWIYDRAGWCPGEDVFTHDVELTGAVTAGSPADIDYEAPAYTWNNAGSRPTWTMANHLVYYNAPNFTVDAAMHEIVTPTDKFIWKRFNPICNKPRVIIRNEGTSTLTSLDIIYKVMGGADSVYKWTGSLDFLETEEVTLGGVDWPANGNRFEVRVANPNGMTDPHALNDTMRSNFNAAPIFPNNIYLYMRTNNQPAETKWALYDADGTVLYQNSPFLAANTLSRDTFNLDQGCYFFRFWDTGKDGLSFFANNDGSGFARLLEVGGSALRTLEPDFGTELQVNFIVDQPLSKEQPIDENAALDVFPNPSQGQINVALNLPGYEQVEIEVYSAMGRRIIREEAGLVREVQTVLDLSMVAKGPYLVKVKAGNRQWVKRVLLTK